MASAVEKSVQGFQIRDWMLVRSELDWIYRGEVKANFRRSSGHGPGQSVLLLDHGTAKITTQAGTVRAVAGEWILAPQQERTHEFSDDAEVLSIHLQLHWPGGEPLFRWDVATKFKAAGVPRFNRQSERLHKFVEKEFPGAYLLLNDQVGSLSQFIRLRTQFDAWLDAFVEMVLALGSVPTRLGSIDPRIFQAVQFLDRFPFRDQFKHADLARQVGLSPTHLDRLFVRQYGVTPRRYLEKRKLEQATMHVRYAAGTGLIKRVAFDLGFNSLAHFSGWFRQNIGVSPTEYQSMDIVSKRRGKGRGPDRRETY